MIDHYDGVEDEKVRQEKSNIEPSPICTLIYPPELSYTNLQEHINNSDLSSNSNTSPRSSFEYRRSTSLSDEEKAIGEGGRPMLFDVGDDDDVRRMEKRERRRRMNTRSEDGNDYDEDQLLLEGQTLGDGAEKDRSVRGIMSRLLFLLRLDLPRGRYVSIGGDGGDEPSRSEPFFVSLKVCLYIFILFSYFYSSLTYLYSI